MARRRYRKVTSGSGKSHQGRRITMAQPVSSIIGDLVKGSRSIAHSDDFEGHKIIQTNSRQLNSIGFEYIVLMSCVVWPNQTPIGTASKFLQCTWVSCSQSYWQGCDLGWYDYIRIWGPLVSATKSMAGTMCINFVDSSQEVCCPIHPAITSWNKTFHSIAGRKGGRFCRCSVCALCCIMLRLFRLAPSCAFLRRLAPPCHLRRLARWCEMVWAQRNNRAMRPQCFIPTSQKHSLSLLVLVSPARTSRQRHTRRPRLLFSFSAKCLHQRQQQQEEAAAAAGGSS